MNGTHIWYSPSKKERNTSWNQKGKLTQNALACCSFDFRFQYILSGWEGSAADASLFHNACLNNLPVPEGKYYLADGGFSIFDALLISYQGVRYHLAEWGCADIW